MKVFALLASAATAIAATPASEIKVPPGFKIELLREAGPREGSWIAMTQDDAGRLYISPQGAIPESGFSRDSKWGGIFRVTFAERSSNPADRKPPGPGGIDPTDSQSKIQWQRVPVPVGDSMGMLWAFDSLYVSGQGPEGRGIYRCKDTDGDSLPDTAVMWKKIPGGAGEHGAHALRLSPDGKSIYIIHGNSTGLIDGIAPDSPYRHWGEDDLIPKLKDPVATFFDGIKSPYGYLLRTDEDGKKWDLIAGGFRNPYDIAFNADDELFTYDSDMEWDRGLPWYRPTRVLHLKPGGEYGFREGSAKMPAYYPDTLPAVCDIGVGCPTGVSFGTGARFPEKYQRAFFICDWTFGRILAVHMKEKGASYTAAHALKSSTFPKDAEASGDVESFLSGKALPITDIEIGKDGAMYLTTGGRGTAGALYRVSYGQDGHAGRNGLPNGEKRRPESPSSPSSPSKATATGEPAAKTALGLRELLSVARTGEAGAQSELLQSLTLFPLAKLPDDLKLLKLRVLELSFARQGRPSEEWQKVGLEKLLAYYPAQGPDAQKLNRELCQLLVWLSNPELGELNSGIKPAELKINEPVANPGAAIHPGRTGAAFHAELGRQAIEKTLALMDTAPTQEEQIQYALYLRWAYGWSVEQRVRYFRWFHEKAARYTGGNSFRKFIEKIHSEAAGRVPQTERAALEKWLAPMSSPVAAAPLKPRAFVKAWTLAELEPALDALKARQPDLARGAELFAGAQCAQCHLFHDAGGNVGPDLSAVAQRFGRHDILEAITDPNKVVSDQYALTTLTVIKFGGGEEQVTGLVQEENSGSIRVLTDPLAGTAREFYHNVVKKKEVAKVSLMPPALLNTLTAEEVADLLAYMGVR